MSTRTARGPTPAGNLQALVGAADRLVARLAQRRADLAPSRCKPLHAPICEREGCSKPLPAGERLRGRRRRFCSAGCRWLDWSARHPRRRMELAA